MVALYCLRKLGSGDTFAASWFINFGVTNKKQQPGTIIYGNVC